MIHQGDGGTFLIHTASCPLVRADRCTYVYYGEKITFENQIKALHDQDLSSKTKYFRKLLKEGCKLDDILHEVFAVLGRPHLDCSRQRVVTQKAKLT